jgi:hypothetical protein
MRRFVAMLSLAAGAAVPTGLAASAAALPASAAPAVAAVTCTTKWTRTTPPTGPTTFPASPAGSVTIGPGRYTGTVKVLSVAPATGWQYFVDTASGNSVDVYFHNSLHRVKFEAGIESPTLMVVMVRVC